VVGRPRGGHRFLKLESLNLLVDFDNLRPGGALRWKVEDRQLEMSGSAMWQADTSKVVAPTCVC
jgi:hypothetical protein